MIMGMLILKKRYDECLSTGCMSLTRHSHSHLLLHCRHSLTKYVSVAMVSVGIYICTYTTVAIEKVECKLCLSMILVSKML